MTLQTMYEAVDDLGINGTPHDIAINQAASHAAKLIKKGTGLEQAVQSACTNIRALSDTGAFDLDAVEITIAAIRRSAVKRTRRHSMRRHETTQPQATTASA